KTRQIHQQLQAGEDFAKLVAIYSESPDRQQQGVMGWFSKGGITQRFAPALELPVGGLTEPIRSPSGFHILKVMGERWQEPEVAGESYDEVHARHILLQIPSYSDEATKAKIRHRAETIADEMQDASDEAFATRAKEASQGPSASKGGDLGWFRKGMMLPEFEEVAFSMKAGETSGVVETQFGLHVIRVVARRHVDPNSLQANREKIQQILGNVEMQEQVPRWINSLRVDADIKYQSCPESEIALPTAQAANSEESLPSQPVDTEIRQAVEQWRQAWSRQNLTAYFNAYSEHFNPGKRFATIDAWKAHRQRMISDKKYIMINVKDIKISHLEENRARIEFTQHYEADSFSTRDRKLLLMEKSASGWKIIREMTAALNK
ncbi:MAG: peptidylprolyl isomerase, partial [Mariprofundus sp.]